MYTKSHTLPGFYVLWKDAQKVGLPELIARLNKLGVVNPTIIAEPGTQVVHLTTRSGGSSAVSASMVAGVLGSTWSWVCEMGRQTLVVKNGHVWSSECSRAKYLGKIGNFVLPSAPTRCTNGECPSAFDALASKYRAVNLELPAFVEYVVPPELQDHVEGLRLGIVKQAMEDHYGFVTGEARQNYPGSPFKTTLSIIIHGQSKLKGYNAKMKAKGVLDDIECGPTEEATKHPQVLEFLRVLPRILGHSIEAMGQVILSRLPAGQEISTHWDAGYYFEYYNRYHFVLQTNEGCIFTIGEESRNMQTGKVFRINNLYDHSVKNNGATDRYHLVVDLRPGSGAPV